MLRSLMLTGLLVAGCATLTAADPAAPELDRCGVDWVRPFSEALATAREQDRLLLIKPIAFGTNAQGCW